MKKNKENISNCDSAMKPKTSLKTFFGIGLAGLIIASGFMAFAPFNQPTAKAETTLPQSTTQSGLITPTTDDPVLFTTEEGVEIKFGLGTLQSGNLSGFPYFNTYSGSNTYTWVIIGANSASLSLNNLIAFETFSIWSTRLQEKYVSEFVTNQYEANSPMGSAINSEIGDGYLSYDKQSFAVNSKVKINATEIPANCVLVLANDVVATGVFNSNKTYITNGWYMSNSCYGRSPTANIVSTMNSYYDSDLLGIAPIKEKIKQISLTSFGGYYVNGSGDLEGTCSYSAFIFPLANRDTFTWSTYLTADQIKLSSNQWLRSGNKNRTESYQGNGVSYVYYGAHIINETGTPTTVSGNSSAGYRPAFVMSLA